MLAVMVERCEVHPHEMRSRFRPLARQLGNDRRRQQIGKPRQLQRRPVGLTRRFRRVTVEMRVDLHDQIVNFRRLHVIERDDPRLRNVAAQRPQPRLGQHQLGCLRADRLDRLQRVVIDILRADDNILRCPCIHDHGATRAHFGERPLHRNLTPIIHQTRPTLISHCPAPCRYRID
jgi:hypothetical protein